MTLSGFTPGLSILLIATTIGHVGGLGVVDRFTRLRHDAVVGRDDQHDHVGDLGAARTHQRERFVTRRIEEDDAAAVAHVDVVRADVLRDAAGLALGNLRFANRVEQRRLAVIDVAHHGDHGRAPLHVFGQGLVAFGRDQLLLEAPHLDLGAELARDVLGHLDVHRAVDGHHHALHQQLGEHVLHADVELVGEILHRHALGERDRARDRRRRCGCRGHLWGRGPLASCLCGPRFRAAVARTAAAAARTADAVPARSAYPDAAPLGCCVRTGCDGSGRGPPSMPGVVGRGGGEYGGRACPGAPGRAAPAGLAPAGCGLAVAPGAGGAGGFNIRGCETCGRFAGASGREGCGVRPGSSMRSRIVGGTKRPAGLAAGACAATAGMSVVGSSIGASSTTGGADGAGSSMLGGGATSGAAATGCTGSGSGAGGCTTAAGSSTISGSSSSGGGAGAGVVSAGGTAGLMVLTRRGGPRTGAVGFGGSAFFGAGAFLAPLAGTGCSANMSPPGSEMLRWRATRSTNERATTSSMVLDALFSSMP